MNRFTAILVLVLMAGSFYVGTTFSDSKTITSVDTVFTTDTVTTPAKIDTTVVHVPVYLTDTITVIEYDTTRVVKTRIDTIYRSDTLFVARADTCFKQGCLEAFYHFPPQNYFEFNWQGKQIRRTIKQKWYMDEKLWGATGFILGILIN